MTDTTLTDTERAGMALMLCECGHDIGGEHNSRGCYHIEWRRDYDLRCDCLLTDDRNVAALIGKRHLAIVAARVADRDTWWRERIDAIAATPDDEQWWPVRPYDDVYRDDEVVQVDVINTERLRALAAEARTQGGASCAK